MPYLQALQVDVVKIDGRYIRDLAKDGRDAVLLRHVVGLCKDLGVTTIAEMIETEAVEDAVRKVGVDLGQGWLYGKPAAEPTPPAARTAATPKRKGVVHVWE
jgi:EAL domain-containing protein (putative c-di-GMP-specific phosphodiesterase class I)